MKKTILTVVALLAVSLSFGQSFEVKRMDGIKIKHLTYTFTDSTVSVTAKGKTDTYPSKLSIISDEIDYNVKDYVTEMKGFKVRFRLVITNSKALLQMDMIDSFTEKVTTVIMTVKEIE